MNKGIKDHGALAVFLSSMIIFGTIGAFRRYIPVSSGTLAFFRGTLGALFLLAVLIFRKKSIKPKGGKKALILLIVSGALIGFNWILLFESYRYTTVATATLCYYLAPTIVMIASPFILKERMTLKKGVCTALSLIGMVLVSGMLRSGLSGNGDIKGILFGLGAASFYAAIVMINRFIPQNEPLCSTFIQMTSASVTVLPYVLFAEDITSLPTDARSVILTVLLGIVHTGLAYTLYFASMSKLKAQTVAVFSYADPVTSLFLSVFLLHEEMTLFAFIGAVLIIGSAVFSVMGEQKSSSPN